MSAPSKHKSLETSELYTVGWISALFIELAAAVGMLDEIHDKPEGFEQPSTDPNSYKWGSIGVHNIVITSLAAGEYGTVSAATTAIHMLSSFPSIKVGLMVGIGAGIARPKQKRDIRLGDVVVSLPHGQSGGVIQYDLGKSRVDTDQGSTTHTFERVGFLNSPPEALLKALTSLRAQVRLRGSRVSYFLGDMLERYPLMAESEPGEPGFVYQGQENDRLFEASYLHTNDAGCDDCDPTRMISRTPRLKPSVPKVHYGVIASGNRLVKDAVERDSILQESGGDCICLEMEAAGLMNSFPCLVIRGICDYADSHKNDDWQEYAAATAAAYAKEFLGFVDNRDIAKTSKASEVLRQISGKIEETTVSAKATEKAIQSMRLESHQKEIKDWLSAPDPRSNYTDALRKRHERTGLWFLDGEVFTKWKRQTGSFLWLHGIPGCGKTILSSTIIEHLKKDTTSGQVLLYFYFSFNDPRKQSFEDMVRSLVSQLYFGQSDTQGPLDQLYDSLNAKGARSLEDSLSAVLLTMLSKVNNVSIVLDALDESVTRNEVLVWVRSVLEIDSSACRILVTARREEDIESALRHWTRPEDMMDIGASDIDEDIKAYVSHTVHNSDELVRWRTRPDVQEEMILELTKKADGM
ncbi:Pfs, NACHT and ankyrin domain protein [Aureobasidium sp. EXF-10728]|nr:Pfs, NACHT and ankyrin domain protein [Aureobasidium sp. EXF-10728]